MFRLHAAWITGPAAGQQRVYDNLYYATAIYTMNTLLREGVCAWIEEIN